VGSSMNDDIRRQVITRLESLAAAGVQFLPRVNAPPLAASPTVSAPSVPPIGIESRATPQAAVAPRPIELELLAQKVAMCTRCPELCSTRTQTVFGSGPLDAELCFVGEAPGADEDRQGVPFVGAAGQLLDRIIVAMGLKREEVYICNILRCRPPGNRQPKPDEAAHCRDYLERTLELVKPKYICALGLVAAQNLLGSRASLGKLRGSFHDFNGTPVICTYHPAALLPSRSPEKKKDVWDDMKMLLAKMGRAVPAVKKG